MTLWSYIDKNGGRQPRQMFCDGYMIAPSGNIVRANDSVLITPGGCTMREYFAHLAAGKPMFGGAFLASTNKSITYSAGALSKVEITIDSVIFADGRIWGPDTRRYYRTVATRRSAMQSVVEEVEAARAGGQDMSAALAKILAETEGKGDQPSFFRHQYAGNVSRSPNPEGRLKIYSDQPPLPEFRHVGG